VNESTKSLVSGRHLARNAVWNFAGLAAPLVVAFFAIPLLIEGMGKERFGLLAIIWMGVGYFSLFDFGLGRALTKLVAARLGADRIGDLDSLIWTALFLILTLGLAGGLTVGLGAGPLVFYVFNVGRDLQTEAIIAFQLLAIGIPAVVLTSAFVGLLEAHQRFATITAVRIPLGVVTFAGPLATVQLSPSLLWATLALLGARMLAFVVYFAAAAAVHPELKHLERPQRKHLYPLVQFGGWLTVTNLVGPLMIYFDRFLVGAVMNMTAVAYYVTPYEVLSRVMLLPRAILGVLFPAMSMLLAGDRGRLVVLYTQSSRTLFLLMLPVFASFFLLAPEALGLWLGDDFRQAATLVVQWLALGWLINTLARMPFTVLQSSGRPDLIAKTHLAELIPYAATLWLLTQRFGIAGTAAAWSLRVFADTVILNLLVGREIPELGPAVQRTLALAASAVACFTVLWLVQPLLVRALIFVSIAIISTALLWPTLKRLMHPRLGA